jgi:Tfp pilus assembly protein PilN
MNILQISSVAEMGVAFWLLILFIAVVGILIQVIIIRWIFRIDRQIENQRAQIWLLMKLCEKNGVTDAELSNFKQSFKIK